MQRLFLVSFICFFISCKSKEDANKPPAADNWVLQAKTRYEYTTNSIGLPDTTFVYTQKFKDGLATDSTNYVIVSRYNGHLITDETAFNIGKDKKLIQHTVTRYIFDKVGKPLARTVSIGGKLLTDEKYSYSDSGLLAKSVVVQIKQYNIKTGGPMDLATVDGSSIGYDTLISNYQYDKGKKVIGTTFTDGSGKMLSKDVNLYSGNDPLLTANINAKGDTTKKITFEKKDKVVMTVTETDSFVLFQNYMNGIQVAQKTKYKNRNEQWRSAVKFDLKGWKIEENLYKSM